MPFAGVLDGLAPLVQPSLAALLALCVVLIVTGRLVPIGTVRRELEAERRICEQQKARADEIKAAQETTTHRADLLVDAVQEILPYARTLDEVVTILRARLDQDNV